MLKVHFGVLALRCWTRMRPWCHCWTCGRSRVGRVDSKTNWSRWRWARELDAEWIGWLGCVDWHILTSNIATLNDYGWIWAAGETKAWRWHGVSLHRGVLCQQLWQLAIALPVKHHGSFFPVLPTGVGLDTSSLSIFSSWPLSLSPLKFCSLSPQHRVLMSLQVGTCMRNLEPGWTNMDSAMKLVAVHGCIFLNVTRDVQLSGVNQSI